MIDLTKEGFGKIAEEEDIPTGNPLMIIGRFVGSAHNIEGLIRNADNISAEEGAIIISQGRTKCTISFPPNVLPKSGKLKVEHYFTFLVSRVAEISVENGKIVQDSFTFKVGDLVDNDMFESYHAAKKSVDKMNDFLSAIHIKLEGEDFKVNCTPFYRVERERGDVRVFVDKGADWARMTAKSIKTTDAIYQLSAPEFRLVSIILEWLRINAKNKGGLIYGIPLNEIVKRMSVDFVGSNAAQNFKLYFSEAIEKINALHGDVGFTVEIVGVDEKRLIKDKIKSGKLLVKPQRGTLRMLNKVKRKRNAANGNYQDNEVFDIGELF